MKRAIYAIVIFMSFFVAGIARAQDGFWVQIQANATLREAEDAARGFAQSLPDVNGFRLGQSGWYAVALGPYSEAAATRRLVELQAQGNVPADSFVADGTAYVQQFWPVGANTLTQAPVTPVAAPETTPEAAPAAPSAPEPVMVEETRDEALRSERELDSDARKALQVALQFEGFYKSLIDGDFGPGTRSAMSAWQDSKGYEPTGVLTTRQRAELIDGYHSFLASIGLAPVTDSTAGIELVMPTAMVSFSRYEAPFAHYEGDQGVRVVLISQQGDRATLFGLYDILQTLSVVPAEGNRSRREDRFTIEGADDKLVTYVEAKLVDGAVKGFMLVWPQGARQVNPETGAVSYATDRRRTMVLDAMRDSFTSTGPTALDDTAGLDEANQSIDLVSGLEIRRPDRARSGFWVTDTGAVLTTIEAIDSCTRITLNDAYPAQVTAEDKALGVALLMPEDNLAPLAVAGFLGLDPRLQSDLAVAGYSYGGRLSSPTLTFGKLADVKGLGGEEEIARLAIRAQDGDTGGPVLDSAGGVAGMLMPAPADGQMLPADVGLVVKGAALADFLAANGITPQPAGTTGALSPYDLSALAANVTVLVSCWN